MLAPTSDSGSLADPSSSEEEDEFEPARETLSLREEASSLGTFSSALEAPASCPAPTSSATVTTAAAHSAGIQKNVRFSAALESVSNALSPSLNAVKSVVRSVAAPSVQASSSVPETIFSDNEVPQLFRERPVVDLSSGTADSPTATLTRSNTRFNATELHYTSHPITPPLHAIPSGNRPRLVSLDVFRGFVILAMIVANYQVEGDAWHLFLHPDWIGLSLADLVFPSFLFIMGVAIPLSASKKNYSDLAKRALKLFGVGLLLNNPIAALIGPPHDFSQFRIMGVLQRAGIVFFIVASAHKALPTPHLFNVAFPLVLLLLWSLGIVIFIPPTTDPDPYLPSCPSRNSPDFSYFTPAHCTAQSYLDTILLGPNHTYRHAPFDNEGTLSTLPAAVSCIAGAVLGQALLRATRGRDCTDGTWRGRLARGMWQGAGAAWTAGFLLLGLGVPLSKNLWTPSFVFVVLGVSLAGLGCAFWSVDGGGSVGLVMALRDLMGPRNTEAEALLPVSGSGNTHQPSLSYACRVLAACGKNPLALYVFSDLLAMGMNSIGLYEPLYRALFASWIWPRGLASLTWSLFWATMVVARLGDYLDSIAWYWRM
ncbi:hypothetical protein BC830DRAFT_1145482 [Chytriomyces sp. MP71]|nr:hypothetical protein BC830DRAFT_1145482 [Chytriomyces sp. MP71]